MGSLKFPSKARHLLPHGFIVHLTTTFCSESVSLGYLRINTSGCFTDNCVFFLSLVPPPVPLKVLLFFPFPQVTRFPWRDQDQAAGLSDWPPPHPVHVLPRQLPAETEHAPGDARRIHGTVPSPVCTHTHTHSKPNNTIHTSGYRLPLLCPCYYGITISHCDRIWAHGRGSWGSKGQLLWQLPGPADTLEHCTPLPQTCLLSCPEVFH